REVLQHTRQLKVIASALEKKIKNELVKLQKEDREKYETFWRAFGTQLKYGVVSDYGQHKDVLQDLLLFWSSKEGGNTTLAAYKDRMPEDQPFCYYACGESVDKIAKLPQVERILDKGYEILYCTEDVDDFVMKGLGELDGKQFKSVTEEDALPQTEEEKKAAEEKAEAGKPVLEAVKEALGDQVKEVRASAILKSGACCLSADGPISIEMEKYMSKVEGSQEMKADRVLELNPDSAPFAALKRAVDAGDKDTVSKYAQLLYAQALLLAGLPLEDPAEYTALVCSLMI
ncbi:MAG: molecular chaperone HtpG, partial [Lawsonibacter sp.]|nr:molecular chaperone HtpG [Lawsonibacter sp.]